MQAIRVAGATRYLGAPRDWKDDGRAKSCGYLAIRDEQSNVGHAMTSAWEIQPHEVAALIKGAPIYLTICGTVHPPVAMVVGSPPDGDLPVTHKIKPLAWRKPKDDGQDFGHEDSVLVADGIGGMYDICTTTLTKKTGGPGFLLWWCYDPFIWEDFATIEDAKAAAEAHWQKSVQAVIA